MRLVAGFRSPLSNRESSSDCIGLSRMRPLSMHARVFTWHAHVPGRLSIHELYRVGAPILIFRTSAHSHRIHNLLCWKLVNLRL